MVTISTAFVRATSVALVALAACFASSAVAQSPERDAHLETCAVLEATPLGFSAADFPNRESDGERIAAELYNFEANMVECPGRFFPTANGGVRPAYMLIGFSNDGLLANVTVETESPTDTRMLGEGYNCVLVRMGARWRPQGCVRVITMRHVGPPTPIPVP